MTVILWIGMTAVILFGVLIIGIAYCMIRGAGDLSDDSHE